MRMRLWVVIGASLAASLFALDSATAAAFTNGGFELPGGDVRDQLTTSYIPGWTYDETAGSYDIYESDDQDGISAADGNHYVSFGHSGTVGGSLSQTFDTVANATYTLTYAFGEQQGDDPTQVIEAILSNGSQTLSENDSPSAIGFTGTGKIVFVAQGPSATLEFKDATPAGDGAGSNLALDAVTLSLGAAAGVPEPATWAMMLVGLGGIGAALRKARRKDRQPRIVA